MKSTPKERKVKPTKKEDLPPSPPPAKKDPNALRVPAKEGADADRIYADLTTQGVMANAALMRTFSAKHTGEIAITEAVESLNASIAEVKGGSLGAADTLLMSQAVALNVLWGELARRAALNMGEHPDAFERYMRLALKAQSQCRTTLETLAEIKNPRAVAFVRQANIAGGNQQVNNGAPTGSCAVRAGAHAGAEKIEVQQTELLQDAFGAPLPLLAEIREDGGEIWRNSRSNSLSRTTPKP